MKDVVYESVWKPGNINMLLDNIQAQYLDMCMVHQFKEAARILQRAINSATTMPSVSVDGIMRKGVASAATKTVAKDVNILKAERCFFYAEEIRRRPNQKQFWVQHTTAVILRSKH
jgi:lysozyme family protein